MNIWAHRGCSQNYPENTLTSFEKAASISIVSGIELDIQLTKDGEIVVIHDEKVDRTTNGFGFVRDYSLKELKNLAIWTRTDKIEHIPTMEEVLDLLSPKLKEGFLINIELKTSVFPYPGIEEKIMNLISKKGFEDNIVYSSFYAISLKNMYECNPDAKLGILDTKVSDCLVKAKGLEHMLGIKEGQIALHPYHSGMDISPSMLENRPVRAWFSGHLFPELSTGKTMDFKPHEEKGITDLIINEPEAYV